MKCAICHDELTDAQYERGEVDWLPDIGAVHAVCRRPVNLDADTRNADWVKPRGMTVIVMDEDGVGVQPDADVKDIHDLFTDIFGS